MTFSTDLIRKHRKMNSYVTDIEEVQRNPDEKFKDLKLQSIRAGDIALVAHRYKLIRKYAFAIPNLEALSAISEYKKIIEIGCGTAYWAYLLRGLFNVDIIAMDAYPIQLGINPYFSPAEKILASEDRCYIIEQSKAYIDDVIFPTKAMVEFTATTRALFICWPSFADDWGFEWLKYYYEKGGKTLIYIGEGIGGCTGTDEFHNFIDTHFKEIKHIGLQRYEGIHDSLTIFERI